MIAKYANLFQQILCVSAFFYDNRFASSEVHAIYDRLSTSKDFFFVDQLVLSSILI